MTGDTLFIEQYRGRATKLIKETSECCVDNEVFMANLTKDRKQHSLFERKQSLVDKKKALFILQGETSIQEESTRLEMVAHLKSQGFQETTERVQRIIEKINEKLTQEKAQQDQRQKERSLSGIPSDAAIGKPGIVSNPAPQSHAPAGGVNSVAQINAIEHGNKEMRQHHANYSTNVPIARTVRKECWNPSYSDESRGRRDPSFQNQGYPETTTTRGEGDSLQVANQNFRDKQQRRRGSDDCFNQGGKHSKEQFYPRIETSVQRYYMPQQERQVSMEELKCRIAKAQMNATIIQSLMATLKPFDGQPHEFQAFMAQFDSMVHENKYIDAKMKQTILFKLLTEEVARLHNPTEYSPKGYWILREGLIKQFGNPDRQMFELLKQIHFTPFPSNDLAQLINHLHMTRVYARKLMMFGVNPSDPSFQFIFAYKLPQQFKEQAFELMARRIHTFDELVQKTLEAVEFKLRMEENQMEKSHTDTILHRKSNNIQENQVSGRSSSSCLSPAQRLQQPEAHRTSTFTPPSRTKPCRYCDDKGHAAVDCSSSLKKKLEAVTRKALCSNCLSKSHGVFTCQSRFNCSSCHKRHFTGHCPDSSKDGGIVATNSDASDDKGNRDQLSRKEKDENPKL
ncbi:hypothetical protein CRE_13069 [Caenorhabditis remanei]|uniref:CCHC-type domain-containing protein n=1 Tax=Caenorhabditis remanei TaxID=31234 RepID=E3N7F8_CAERE|nr:hypothetical protein CRE_13069 [Caenorhabditis remanei]